MQIYLGYGIVGYKHFTSMFAGREQCGMVLTEDLDQ